MTQGMNEWRVTLNEWLTIRALFWCGCVFVLLCLSCHGCLPMCVHHCEWSYPADVGLQIRTNTQQHTVIADQTRIDTAWARLELKGPDWVWLWSWPQHPLTHTDSAPGLLICFTCPSGIHAGLELLLQIEPSVVSDRESSSCNWKLCVKIQIWSTWISLWSQKERVGSVSAPRKQYK